MKIINYEKKMEEPIMMKLLMVVFLLVMALMATIGCTQMTMKNTARK